MNDIILPPRGDRNSVRPLSRGVSNGARVVYSRHTRRVDSSGVTEVDETTVAFVPEPAPMTRGVEHLSAEDKALAIERALRFAQSELKSERRKRRDLKRFGLVFIASIFVLATGYVSIDTWMTNARVKADVEQQTATSSTGTQAEEGSDEAPVAADALANYSVAQNLPRALYIDKIGIAARILPMGVNSDGSIQAPRNIFDAGWYTSSVKPGEPGAAFIDGHASGATREGLFANLDRLVKGDVIKVERGDGTILSYRVTHTEIADLNAIDMKKVLSPYGDSSRGLNLMTCTGKWLADQKTYNQRVIVWTEQVS